MTSAAAYPSYRMELSHSWRSDQVIRAVPGDSITAKDYKSPAPLTISCIFTLIRHFDLSYIFSLTTQTCLTEV